MVKFLCLVWLGFLVGVAGLAVTLAVVLVLTRLYRDPGLLLPCVLGWVVMFGGTCLTVYCMEKLKQ